MEGELNLKLRPRYYPVDLPCSAGEVVADSALLCPHTSDGDVRPFGAGDRRHEEAAGGPKAGARAHVGAQQGAPPV